MDSAKLKSDLQDIAKHLPDSASYEDAMYELYLRMKVSAGRDAVLKGRVMEHADVRAKFT